MLGAAVFLYLRTFWVMGVPFVAHDDQMLFFARAVRMVRGQMPYRDFFELVTPGTDLIYSAGFGVFGVRSWVPQAWCILLGVMLAGVITWIAGRVLRGWLVLLPGLLFLVFDFDTALDATHHWYSTLAALGAAGVLMGGAGLWRIAGAGALAGVAMVFTQTQGALVFGALGLYLLWLGRWGERGGGVAMQLAALAIPFGAMVCGVLGYYSRAVGFGRLWFDLVVFPLRYLSSGEVNSPRTYLRQMPAVHGVGDLFHLIPAVFIYALVPYCYFVGLYRLWRERETMPVAMRERLVVVHGVGLALFAAVASAPRLHRLCTVAGPAIVVCVWLLSGEGGGVRAARRALCGVAAVFAVALALSRQVQRHEVMDLPIGRTAFLDPLEFREVEWLAQRTRPGEMFFNQSSIGFYLGLESPSASDFVNTDDYTRPEQVTRVIADMKRRPPRFVVMAPGLASEGADHDHSEPFVVYVHERYRLAAVFPLNRGARVEEVWELRE